MGIFKDGSIINFWPDDTDDEFWLDDSYGPSYSIQDITSLVHNKWPDVSLSNIAVEAKYIYTRRLTSDVCDPDDYTQFIKISKIKLPPKPPND